MTATNNNPALICPGCEEEALARPPSTWNECWGPRPAHSHVDGEPLCPVMTNNGYRPAEPVTPEDTP